MKLMLCLPGNNCTANHRDCLVTLLLYLNENGIDWRMKTGYASDPYLVRNNIVRGKRHIQEWSKVKPFDGEDYDFMVWIDSDVAFSPQDVLRLVNHNKDIVSGMVCTGPGGKAPFGRFDFDEEGNPGTVFYRIAKVRELAPRNDEGLVEVGFVGFAFIVIKKGVFEKMGYPYFFSTFKEHGGLTLETTEDIGWCVRAKDGHGFRIFVDPEIEAYHEKRIPITTRKGGWSKKT